MTGYGSGSAHVPDTNLQIDIQLTSVNRKNLDIIVTAPREWSGFEQHAQQWIKPGFKRGRINLQVKIQATDNSDAPLLCNHDALDAALERMRAFAEARNLPFQPDTRLLLELSQTLASPAELPDWREIETSLHEAFRHAASEVESMRTREGALLQNDLSERLRSLEKLREHIAGHAAGMTRACRDALLERLRQLDLDLDPSDERVLKEVALYADRSDISEELTRLQSHLQQFHDFLESADPAGRKMDFLCQEIQRELNTIGAKSNILAITRSVIEGKNTLEQIREQVQNVE
ncbi:MAG: YicC/YloC family endoribonuclease [Opitutales bacterium]